MRSLCASVCVGAADCASRTRGEHKRNKANKQRKNVDIVLFSSIVVQFQGREETGLRDTLASVGRGGKSKNFMDAIRCLILQRSGFMKCESPGEQYTPSGQLAESLRLNILCWISGCSNNCIACTIFCGNLIFRRTWLAFSFERVNSFAEVTQIVNCRDEQFMSARR